MKNKKNKGKISVWSIVILVILIIVLLLLFFRYNKNKEADRIEQERISSIERARESIPDYTEAERDEIINKNLLELEEKQALENNN